MVGALTINKQELSITLGFVVDPLWDKHRIYCARCCEVIHRIIRRLLSLITHNTFAEREEYLLYFSVQTLLRLFVLQFLGPILR